MRRSATICAFAFLIAGPAAAQPPSPQASASLAGAERAGGEWTEYQNVRDGFHALFPSEPRVTETTWKSQTGFTLPARVYSVERGRERYAMTVADYTGVEQLGAERVKTCARRLGDMSRHTGTLRSRLLEARRPRRAALCHVGVHQARHETDGDVLEPAGSGLGHCAAAHQQRG